MLKESLLSSREYAALSPRAVKLLIDIGSQYNGKNNGDLCAALEIMKSKGWKKATLHRATMELLEAEFIFKTQQGGRHKPSLYALTFFQLDECGGKLEVPIGAYRLNCWRAKN